MGVRFLYTGFETCSAPGTYLYIQDKCPIMNLLSSYRCWDPIAKHISNAGLCAILIHNSIVRLAPVAFVRPVVFAAQVIAILLVVPTVHWQRAFLVEPEVPFPVVSRVVPCIVQVLCEQRLVGGNGPSILSMCRVAYSVC